MPVGQNHTVRFGPFELDSQCGELRKSGVRLKLQGQPIQILEMLVAKPGELVTREEIQQRLWPADTFVDFDHSLNTAVKKLRQALGDEADAPRYIETLPKRGYRFMGEVPAPITVIPQLLTTLPKNLRWRWVLAGCVVLVVAVGALIWFTWPRPLPTITGSHPIVKHGYSTLGLVRPLTDGKSIYFQEGRPSGVFTLSVPVTGGAVSELEAFDGALQDISRDGSALLFTSPDDPQWSRFNLWTLPLPAGPAQLIVRDGVNPIWSLDGRRVFFSREDDLYRANADGTDVQRLAVGLGVNSPHLSPDGSHIRYSAGRDFSLWEVATDGTHPHSILSGYNYASGGTWSLDGEVYFFSAWDGDRSSLWAVREGMPWWRRLWQRNSALVAKELTPGPTWLGPPTISKDGRQLYAAGEEHEGELSVYDGSSSKFVPYLGGISACYVDFTRKDQWMAYVSYPEGTLWRSKLDGSEKMQLTSSRFAVTNPRWSPDGELIAFQDMANGDKTKMNDASPHPVYIVSRDGGAPLLVLSGDARATDPTWSPGGDRIAYGDGVRGQVSILDLQTHTSTKVLGSEGMWEPHWSPDGKHLVAFSGDSGANVRSIMLFTFATNAWEKLASVTGFYSGSWSHDSRFVYAEDTFSVIRIDVASHKRETVIPRFAVRTTTYYWDRGDAGWFGLDSNDRPIITRDIGIEGIYAFDLEYK